MKICKVCNNHNIEESSKWVICHDCLVGLLIKEGYISLPESFKNK